MAFIWNSQALEELLSHPSTEVQRWAIDKALELYPGVLSDLLISLVSPAAPETSWIIMRHLAELTLPISNFDPLVSLARSDADSEVKALAGSVLLRSGYALLPDDIQLDSAATFVDIIGLTDQGFDLVLQAYRRSGEKNKSILYGIARVCSFDDLPRDLARVEDKGGLKKRIGYFRQIWRCNIPPLEQLSQPEKVLSVFDEALGKMPPRDDSSWKRGLLLELECDRKRLAALREIAGERASRWSTAERDFLLSCILCLWRNEACWVRLAEVKDVTELWRALIIKPWRGVPGQGLQDFLLSVNPKELLESLSKVLHHEYSYASYAFSILNILDTPGRFELFLKVFEGKEYGDILAEEAGEAIKKAGAPVVEHIIEHYSRMSKDLRVPVLFVLNSFPIPQVVDFCLNHFEEYMCSSGPEEFVSCLEEIASRDFLPPLLQAWKEGEIGIGTAVKLISEINGIRDQQIDMVVQDTESRTRKFQEVSDSPISSFPLRCTECGRTYNYELENIYVYKGGSPVIGDIIECKGCGSIETYEIPARTHFGFMAEISRLVAARKEQPEKPLDSFATPLRIYKEFEMSVLGRKVKSTGDAYRLLKGEIEKHPQNADLQKRMGNLLKRGGKPELALPYYLEAIELDPSDAESHYSIVDILIDQKRHEEAIPYLERLVAVCREGEIEEGLRRQIFSALFYQVAIIERETGHKIEFFPLDKRDDLSGVEAITIEMRSFDPSDSKDFEWLYHMFRYGRVPKGAMKQDLAMGATQHSGETRRSPAVSGEKIGRNAPCPCGSGKKYKKCCGQ